MALRSSLFVHFFKRPAFIAGRMESAIKAKGPEGFGELVLFLERVCEDAHWEKVEEKVEEEVKVEVE